MNVFQQNIQNAQKNISPLYSVHLDNMDNLFWKPLLAPTTYSLNLWKMLSGGLGWSNGAVIWTKTPKQ